MTEFLVKLFKVSDPSESRGNTITAREILDKGAERITTELKDEPVIQATLMGTIGRVDIALGLYDRAQPLLESALATRRGYFGDEHPQVAESRQRLATLPYIKGDYKQSEQLYRQSLELVRKLLGNEHTHVATTLLNLGTLCIRKGEYSSAEQFLREALTMKRKLFGDQSTQVVVPLRTFGECLTKMTRYDDAEQMLIEAYQIGQNASGTGHPSTIKTVKRLADLYDSWDAAEPGKGHAEKAAVWRMKLEATSKSQNVETSKP